mmetsp:Transcript_17741/g.41808  ORF Transcript_17741/g.41808 Transcript_17741/m.41808 type:complete len:830 (-) Transcript_17741:91-2580(-)
MKSSGNINTSRDEPKAATTTMVTAEPNTTETNMDDLKNSTPRRDEELQVGSPIWVRRKGQPLAQGVVEYLGSVDFAEGDDWVGVRLTGSSVRQGKNNGIVAGKTYFQCLQSNSGLFVRRSSVTFRRRAVTSIGSTNWRKNADATRQQSPVVRKQVVSTDLMPSMQRPKSASPPAKTKQIAQRPALATRTPSQSFPLGLTINVATPILEGQDEHSSASPSQSSPALPVFLFSDHEDSSHEDHKQKRNIKVPSLNQNGSTSLSRIIAPEKKSTEISHQESHSLAKGDGREIDLLQLGDTKFLKDGSPEEENAGNERGSGTLPPGDDDDDEEVEFDDQTGISTIETTTIHRIFESRHSNQHQRMNHIPSVLTFSQKVSSSLWKNRDGSNLQKKKMQSQRFKELERWRAGKKGKPTSKVERRSHVSKAETQTPSHQSSSTNQSATSQSNSKNSISSPVAPGTPATVTLTPRSVETKEGRISPVSDEKVSASYPSSLMKTHQSSGMPLDHKHSPESSRARAFERDESQQQETHSAIEEVERIDGQVEAPTTNEVHLRTPTSIKNAILLRKSRTRLFSASKKLDRQKESDRGLLHSSPLDTGSRLGTNCGPSSPASATKFPHETNESKKGASPISAASCLNDLFWLVSLFVIIFHLLQMAAEGEGALWRFLGSIASDDEPKEENNENQHENPGLARVLVDRRHTKAAWNKLKGAFRSLSNRNSKHINNQSSLAEEADDPCMATAESNSDSRAENQLAPTKQSVGSCTAGTESELDQKGHPDANVSSINTRAHDETPPRLAQCSSCTCSNKSSPCTGSSCASSPTLDTPKLKDCAM